VRCRTPDGVRPESGSHVADGVHHAGQLTGNVGARRLIDQLGDSARLVFGGPLALLRSSSAERELRKQVGRQRDRLLIHIGEPYQVPFMGDEVTLGGQDGLDRRDPLGPAG
jgi:hypothetical protein